MDMPRSDDFVLVDLDSQARAVYRLTHGWSREQFIGWLAQRGILESTANQDAFRFMSRFGLCTVFHFTTGRRFIVVYWQGPTTRDPLRDEPDDSF
jgi:hypothetical protein